jgi:hypothetical protein
MTGSSDSTCSGLSDDTSSLPYFNDHPEPTGIFPWSGHRNALEGPARQLLTSAHCTVSAVASGLTERYGTYCTGPSGFESGATHNVLAICV